MKCYSRYFIVLVAALLLMGPIVVNFASAGSKGTLIIAGTGSSIGAMQLMTKGFQKKHPGVTVEILPSIGTTGGIKAVQEGKIDIGLSARPLRPEERGVGISEVPCGRTAFIFGVQESNPVQGFTLAEIEAIFARKRKDWSDGTPIRLILRPVSDAYSIYLASINPGLKSASETARSIPGVFVGITDQDAARQIERTPGAFGTTCGSIIAVEKIKIKALSIDGVAPTLANVAAGKYPFSMTMSMVYKKDKDKGVVQDFIAFVFSRDGQMCLSDTGHVTLRQTTSK